MIDADAFMTSLSVANSNKNLQIFTQFLKSNCHFKGEGKFEGGKVGENSQKLPFQSQTWKH